MLQIDLPVRTHQLPGSFPVEKQHFQTFSDFSEHFQAFYKHNHIRNRHPGEIPLQKLGKNCTPTRGNVAIMRFIESNLRDETLIQTWVITRAVPTFLGFLGTRQTNGRAILQHGTPGNARKRWEVCLFLCLLQKVLSTTPKRRKSQSR